LLDILKSRSEVERSYGSIWLYLSSRQLGLDGVEAVRTFTPSTDKNAAWPYPVLQYLQGQLDWSSALAATREKDTSDRGRECELYFYASQKALLDQDISKARTFLQKSLATGVAEFNEYSMAQRELDRIGPR
jgi:lipoprotein NlpI